MRVPQFLDRITIPTEYLTGFTRLTGSGWPEGQSFVDSLKKWRLSSTLIMSILLILSRNFNPAPTQETGRCNVNDVPSPGADCTVTLPPSARRVRSTRHSPSPAPLVVAAFALCPR